MDSAEREALKNEILTELEEKLKGVVIREDIQNVLSPVRNKWFTDKKSNNKNTPMYEMFGSVVYWTVWELIRKLTCIICGCGYVRHLSYMKNQDEVNMIAETLCQTVFDLRKNFLEKGNKEQ